MFWSITFVEQGNYVKVAAEGDFTLEDCKKIKEDFIAADFWLPGKNVLYDYRRTNFSSSLTLDALRGLGAFHESRNEQIGSGRMALLMKSPHDFGLARQYEMLTDGRVLSQIRVFLDENEAVSWICAPPESN